MVEGWPTLVVVDNGAHSREVLRGELARSGFRVLAVSDALSALAFVERETVHAIVIDLRLVAIDGVSLILLLRRMTDAPIVVLAAQDDVAAGIAGLKAGADAYFTKPFASHELAARLYSALRRPQLRENSVVACADLMVDTARRHVERAGETIALSAREFDIVAALVREPGRIFTREDLVELVWSPRSVKAGTVESYICVLRAKIDKPPRTALIQTVRGVGYRLSASP